MSTPGQQAIDVAHADIDRDGFESPCLKIPRQPAISRARIDCNLSTPRRFRPRRKNECTKLLERASANRPDWLVPPRMKWQIEIVAAPTFRGADPLVDTQ